MRKITKGICVSVIFFGVLLSVSTSKAQERIIQESCSPTSLNFSWQNLPSGDVVLEYGETKSLEAGKVVGLSLKNLKPATMYHVKATHTSSAGQSETSTGLFSTASRLPGEIRVYFNQWVDNDASDLADAVHAPAFEDSIIAWIDAAEDKLDVCMYNTGSLPIVSAVNAAESRGVTVRYIAADNTGTNNSELSSLDPDIPMLQRPSDGGVMHNKFIIIDADTEASATVVTGSANHTDNSLHADYNNIVFIRDHALAQAYQLEFEEMWGNSGDNPDPVNALFGEDKTDNTPHVFNIGGTEVELYFSPSDNTTARIEQAILSAGTDLQFAVLTFINNTLGDAVISAHDSGVDVKGIIENIYYLGSEYYGLQNAGIDVHSHFDEPHFLHHKYGVVDAGNPQSDPVVVTGSHNWTNSAEEEYDENTLLIHDAEIAGMYYEEFMARYAELVGVNPENRNTAENIIFPNPCPDEFTIQSRWNIQSIAIYNASGKQVFEKKNVHSWQYRHNTEVLPPGIYCIRIKTTERDYTEKLTIIR
ncbi:MAG: phospholipase D-like domain-containing protein [Bacteroidales bacterium]